MYMYKFVRDVYVNASLDFCDCSVARTVARNREDPYMVAVVKDGLLFSWP